MAEDRNGGSASLTTPLFKLDLQGRNLVIIILFAALILTVGAVNYLGQEKLSANQAKSAERQVEAINNLANEQRFNTCVLWVIADRTPNGEVALDERLLRQKCWWVRRELLPAP